MELSAPASKLRTSRARHFCPSTEPRNGNVEAFLLSTGVICPDAEAPDSARQAQCPSMEPWNGNVEAFLLDAGAKSLGVGVICPDARVGKGNAEVLSSGAGAKTLDDGVPRPAQQATETADAAPRNDCAAESIVQGR
jgi:hypothetical protein